MGGVMCTRCFGFGERATREGRRLPRRGSWKRGCPARLRRKRCEAVTRSRDAAAFMRETLRKAGRCACASCGTVFLVSAIDVDHIVPLALGGEDVAGNVQPLCRPCHKLKTRGDFQV
ncbi:MULTISPECIES: HNH endonuclease [Streptomyces]|uniref:HNH endonuclease n=1 Tax=Streptomyces TaxID=1883 RepID=UPI000B9E9057